MPVVRRNQSSIEVPVTSVHGRTGDVTGEPGDYSHTELDDIGVNTHDQIDTALSNAAAHIADATIHFVDTFVHDSGDESIDGVKTLTSFPRVSGTPTLSNELVNKAYADAFAQGVKYKDAVRVATTTAGTLASDFENGDTIDGVVLATGNRILIKNQADPIQNGIYVVAASGAPTRATDFDQDSEVVAGSTTFVLEGTVNGNKLFAQNAIDPVVNTDPITFVNIGSIDPITGSNGIVRVGNDFQIDLAADPGLELSGGKLRAKVDDTTIERTAGGLVLKEAPWADVNKTGSKLEDIADAADLASATDGQVPVWNDAESKWEPGDAAGSVEGVPVFAYDHIDLQTDASANLSWTIPVALTAGSAALRKRHNLEGVTQFRIHVYQQTAGSVGSKIRAMYSLNNSTFQTMDDSGTDAGDLDVGAGTGVKTGSWVNLAPGAKADVWIQLYGLGGNGSTASAYRQIYIEVKKNSSVVDQSASTVADREATFHSHPNSALAWTAMPAALTEFLGSANGRKRKDLSGITHYRIHVTQSVAGAAGADLNLQYSINAGSTWNACDTAGAGECAIGTGTGPKNGAWAALVDGAKQDVLLRLVGKDGNASAAPAFRQVYVEFKGTVTGPMAGSDKQVIFNDAGNAGAEAGFEYDKTLNKLTVPAVKITGGTPGVGKFLASDADGDASWEIVAQAIADLTDVDFSTPPTNGQIIAFDDQPGFFASLSPLNWNGNDYQIPNFGGGSVPSVLVIWAGNPQIIDADPTQIDLTELGALNIHVALVTFPGPGGKSTMYTCDNVASTAAALEAILQSEVDPSITVDNFKANYITNNGDDTFTFNGFTGFDQAGTVSVVSGETTPPTIELVAGDAKFKPIDLPVKKVFAMGVDRDSQGPPAYQTIADSTPTVLNMTDTFHQLAGWHGDESPGKLNIEGPDGDAAIGAVFTVNVLDDNDDPIPTMLVEIQESLPGDVWRTIGAGYAGSAVAVTDFDASVNGGAWRVQVTQTSGGPVDVAHRFQVEYTPE